jgi:photosystem II stability/assembly factor-like uncharacterized protein
VKMTPARYLLFTVTVLAAYMNQAPAQSPGYFAPIAGFDLVAPGIGWAASSTHLYWTVSNGRRWRDITPPRASEEEPIQLVHFNDRSHGWALMIDAVENQPTLLEIESTSNGGASWRLATVDLSHSPIDAEVSPSIDSMSFSDHAHGWILIGTSSPGIRNSVLVVTADAGSHWRVLRTLPVNGNISFGSPVNGVLTVSNPNGDAPVWHTRDGGKSWAASDLPAPGNCIPVHVDTAHFFTGSHAVLTALIKAPGRDDVSSIEYVTVNGGATWRPTPVPAQRRIKADVRLTTVTDGHIVAIGAAPHNSLVLKMKGSTATIPLPPGLTPGAIDRLSVASNRTAWAFFSAPQTDLVSIDPQRKIVKVITPRPSKLEHPAPLRHQRAPKSLLIHCTLVSARLNAHDQPAPNDIIRPNAALKTR